MSTSVGFFDHFDEAQKAVQALEDEGIDSGRISIIPEDSDPTRDNMGIPVTGGNVKSKRHLVSVETRSPEEDRIVKEILSGAGASHLETRGGSDNDNDDPASRYLKGTDY